MTSNLGHGTQWGTKAVPSGTAGILPASTGGKQDSPSKCLHRQRVPAGSRRSQGLAALFGAGLLLALALPATALACAKDGIPSVSVDGHLAVRNTASGRIEPASWTYFIFKQTVRHGQTVTLAENNREVARALPRAYFSHPWRWTFGDKSRPAEGTRVRHVYRKPGTYRIVVSGYYPGYHAWLPFDEVTIRVR